MGSSSEHVSLRRSVLFALLLCILPAECAHFAGSIIMWEPTGTGTQIRVIFRMSWNRRHHNCDDSTIANSGLIGEGYIQGFPGCSMSSPAQIVCTDFSIIDNWSSGRNTFTYTPPAGQSLVFSFGFTGGAWIGLVTGGGSWSLKTTANVSIRTDINRINSSPTVEMSPVVQLQQGCSYSIKLPVADADGDDVRCRFATGSQECAGVCNSFPNSTINSNTCTISYTANGSVGWYAVAVQIEDFQSWSTQPLSTVALQFLVKVFSSGSTCGSAPVFVHPTPTQQTCLPLKVNVPFVFRITAFSASSTISNINTVSNGPTTTTASATNYTGNYMTMTVSWTPNSANKGSHAFCFTAVDLNGLRTEQRCVYLYVEAQPVLGGTRKTENGTTVDWELIYDKGVTRPNSSAYIQMFYENDTLYGKIDATSNNVTFGSSSIRFSITVDLTVSYYILLDAGIALGGCNQASEAMANKTRIVMKRKDCAQPPILPHGSLIVTSTLYGGIATATCDMGYNMTSGNEHRTCGADENWSGSQPTCAIVDCGEVERITNGSVNVTGTTYGQNATYRCDPGFDISDVNGTERVCSADGNWTGQQPSCIIKDCLQPPTIQNGNWIVSTTVYLGVATSSCDTGYNLTSGDKIRTCEEDGQWSGLQPTCTIVDCGNLPQITNGEVTITGSTYGENVTNTCDPGFDISNESLVTLTCTADGTWSGDQPVCNIKDCGPLSNITNGILSVTGSTYGENVTYACDRGFDLSDEAMRTRTCQADGNWSGNTPVCNIKDCKKPPNVSNGSATMSGTTYGQTVTYKCDDGYFMSSGDMLRRCAADGSWTGSSPTCTEKYHVEAVCRSDLLTTSQCKDVNTSCRFDSYVGRTLCKCLPNLVNVDGTCLKTEEHEGGCKISLQCQTFLAECVNGKCVCTAGRTFNSSIDECVSEAIPYCDTNTDRNGRMWEKAKLDTTVYQECPDGFTGVISRTCSKGGKFSLALYNCTKKIFNDIAEQLQNKSLTTTEALETLKDAVNDGLKNSSEIFAGDVDAIGEVLAQIAKEPDKAATAEELKKDALNFFEIADRLTDPEKSGPAWESKVEQSNKGAERFIEAVDQFAENIAATLATSSQTNLTIEKENLVVTVSEVPPDVDLQYPSNDQRPTWNTSEVSSFTLDSAALSGQNEKVTGVVVVVYRDISMALPKTNAHQPSQSKEREIHSQVLSIQLLPKPPKTLKPPIKLTFQTNERKPGFESHCSFWKTDKDGSQSGWSTSGCTKTMSSSTEVQCSCSHLTNFAILISPAEAPDNHADALSVITLTGCAISIVCLIITILLHVAYWRFLKGDRNILAMAVCSSLLFAYFLFVFGINRTSVKGLCTTIAVLLHYAYLLVFFLMLSEGIYMMLQVVFLFHKKSHLRELLIGSFALPAVIVLIVASATKLDGYGNEKYCWLTVNSVAFWMFAGPALIVILFNLSIILVIMKKMYGTKWIKDMNQREKAKTLAGKMLVLLPVMGVTWIFGILAVDESSVALQYLFVIFNSFQGVFIFLFHCVLNRQMRTAIAKTREKRSCVSEEKSRMPSRPDQSTISLTTNTHANLPSTAPTDERNALRVVTEEEKQQFKKRHALPPRAKDAEDKHQRPATQVFIDLQYELTGRVHNMFTAVADGVSKVVSSAKQSVAFTKNTNSSSFRKDNSEDQIDVRISPPPESDDLCPDLEATKHKKNDGVTIKTNNEIAKMVVIADVIETNTDRSTLQCIESKTPIEAQTSLRNEAIQVVEADKNTDLPLETKLERN